MFIGLDGALHLAEECLEPEKTVPRALLSTIGIGFTTGFVFVVAMCYSIVDLKSLLITKSVFTNAPRCSPENALDFRTRQVC